MNIFDHPEFDQHESVSFFSAANTGQFTNQVADALARQLVTAGKNLV